MSPPSLETEFELPNSGIVKGMGIPAGVTLIVGGGFHGKSTLLKVRAAYLVPVAAFAHFLSASLPQALEVGVYNHIPGDGREMGKVALAVALLLAPHLCV